MKTKTEKWDTLFDMIPNKLKGKYTIVTDQINSKTFALAKRNKEVSERYNFGHDTISNFMTYSEMKAYLLGLYDGLNKKFK